MDEKWLSNYLNRPDTTEQQALIELKKYRAWVSERISTQSYTRMTNFLKKRSYLQTKRLKDGFKLCLENIHKHIEEGTLWKEYM